MSDLPITEPAATAVPAPVHGEHVLHARPRTEAQEPAAGLVPEYVRRLAWVLDDAIPLFAGRRIGIDGFLSMIPVVGEAAGFGLAAVVVLSGVRAGCSWVTIARMLFHAVGESLVGMIPVAGPAVAFFWKANNRNLRIIEKNLQDREATRRESWKVLLFAAGLFVTMLGVAALGFVIAVYTLWQWLAA